MKKIVFVTAHEFRNLDKVIIIVLDFRLKVKSLIRLKVKSLIKVDLNLQK